jgi:hypothetical protein
MSRWFAPKTLRSRQRSAAVGTSFEVPAKIRLQRSGLGGRWREGILYRDGAQVKFRPRKPRLGSTLDLAGSLVTGTRVAEWWEFLWFSGPTVLLMNGPLGAFELGAGNDKYIELARTIFDDTHVRRSARAVPE